MRVNATLLLAVLLAACAALYISAGRGSPALSSPEPQSGAAPGYYSARSRLLACANGLAGFRNKTGKRLESGRRAEPLSAKDVAAVLKICMDLEQLLLELSRGPYARPYLSQVEAARIAGRELLFETVKLKSLISGRGPDSGAAAGQLLKVEERAGRLQTHVEGLILELSTSPAQPVML